MGMIDRAGFSYDPGDIDAVADGLRRWYQARHLLHEARRQSWEWGTRQFNWDYERQKFLEVVERVLNKEMCDTSVGR